jgi:hypothetical protein
MLAPVGDEGENGVTQGDTEPISPGVGDGDEGGGEQANNTASSAGSLSSPQDERPDPPDTRTMPNDKGGPPSPEKSAALLVLTALIGLIAAIGGLTGALDRMFAVAPVLATLGIGMLFIGAAIAIGAGLLPSVMLPRREFKATHAWRELERRRLTGSPAPAAAAERAEARFNIQKSRNEERTDRVALILRIASALALLLGTILILAALAQRIQTVSVAPRTSRPAISGSIEATDRGLMLHAKVVASGMDSSKSLVVRGFWTANPNFATTTTASGITATAVPTSARNNDDDPSLRHLIFEQVAGPVDGTATVEADILLQPDTPQPVAVLARVGSTAHTSDLNGLTTSGDCRFDTESSSTSTTVNPNSSTTAAPDDSRSGCLVFFPTEKASVAGSTAEPPTAAPPTMTRTHPPTTGTTAPPPPNSTTTTDTSTTTSSTTIPHDTTTTCVPRGDLTCTT